MKFSWIFFDADNTLLDFKAASRQAFEETMQAFELPGGDARYYLYKRINDACWEAYEQGRMTAQQLRRRRFEQFLDSIGNWRDPVELNSHYLQCLSSQGCLVEGARETLQALEERGFHLAIITNGLQDVQRPRLKCSGLTDFFHTIVISDEIGSAKPQSEFFEEAFRQAGHPAREEVLVVGDSLRSDILGGLNYGLSTCWFNPTGHTPEPQTILPHFTIRRLQQVLDIVDSGASTGLGVGQT